MYQNINKIYHAAIYVRLSKEDGDISSSAKLESNSISNQKALILDFLKDKKDIEVVIEEAKMYDGIVLIMDEIHRLNKDKQDILSTILQHEPTGKIE